MAEDWTEKYRPSSLKDIVGNAPAAAAMRKWADQWNKGIPAKRAMVLMGTPGIGKTSSAEALAHDMGWGIVEMNASDQRTGDVIRDVALRASYFDTFGDDGTFMSAKTGGRKLIVLDEADCLFGNADRGAMPAINELIRSARQPVVLIVNEFYGLSRKSSAVKNDTLQITFKKPLPSAVREILVRICAAEKAEVDPEAITAIANNANGDMRAAIRDLESLVYGTGRVSAADTAALEERNIRKDMYTFLDAVFRKRDPQLAFRVYNEVNEEPETVALWLEENIPYECRSTGDLVRCCEKLSRADVYLGHVYKRMNYGFRSYARDMMINGMTDAIHSRKANYGPLRFPQYLSKMSRSKSARGLRKSLCMKLGYLTHTSVSRIQNDCYDHYRAMAIADADFRVMLVRDAGLEPEELGFLIDKRMDSAAVKQAFEAAFPEKTPGKKGPEAPEEEPAAEPVTEKTPEAEAAPEKTEVPAEPEPPKKTQMSLFDF